MALTERQIQETKDAFDKHGGNKAKAALELGLTRSALQHRLDRMAQGVETVLAASSEPKTIHSENVIPFNGLRQNQAQKQPSESHPAARLNVRVKEWKGPAPANDEAIRVCVIGDLHVAPGQDLSRLKWIARHIGETQPDHIVQIGDWASFDSVSAHDPIGSIKAKNRPTMRHDFEALHESLRVFDAELGPSTIPRICTLGNHEHRVRRYEELRSELENSLWVEVLEAFARFRWRTYDYGKVVFIGGVGFVHVPLNVIGKPHSSPNIMGNNLAHDLVKGHSHRATYQTFSKIGEDRGVMLIDVGTSLMHGHVEQYAKLSQTSWWWGIHNITIRGGRIDDFERISMRTLEARYG